MNWKTPTVWMTLTLLVVGAVAVPALAQPEDAGRPDDAGSQADDHRRDGNRSADAGAHAGNASHEAREARNGSFGHEQAAAHEPPQQARRAAHGLMKAVDALEHRIVTLEKLEKKFGDKLEEGNLTENETAAFEAKLERIQEMQNATLERIEAMEERLDRIKDRWEDAREHVRDFRDKVVVCHVAEDDDEAEAEDNSTANATGNVSYVTIEISRSAWPAHEAHGDSLGACEGDDESDAVDEDELQSEEQELESEEEESEDGSDDASDEEEDESEEEEEESEA